MAKSIQFLNNEFIQVQKGQGFNTGSITPKTTTKKLVLDRVEISDSAKKLYESNLLKNTKEKFVDLTKLDEQNLKKYKPLSELVDIDKKYKPDLDNLEKEIISGKENIKLIENSLSREIKEFKWFGFETIYQEDIQGAQGIQEYTPTVLRYGLNTESKALDDIVESCIEKGVLHPYEEAIFQNAFEYLKMVESADSYIKTGNTTYYPNNVVLVDIFDRSSGFINKGNNQTHTIALWKKKDDEIVLIDPSQRSYSDHLLNPIKSIFNINVSALECKMLYGVAVYKGNEITGYSDYTEQSPKPRDCVDIAIKIVFELNEQQKFSSLDKITDNMLQQISNDLKSAPHLTKLAGFVIRELQSSNFQNRYESKKIVKDVNDGLMNKIVPTLNVNKIKNYQNIEELKTVFTNLQKFV